MAVSSVLNFSKILLVSFTLIFLILSVILSIHSFTGYLIAEIPDNYSNNFAIMFFILGLFSAFFTLRRS